MLLRGGEVLQRDTQPLLAVCSQCPHEPHHRHPAAEGNQAGVSSGRHHCPIEEGDPYHLPQRQACHLHPLTLS